MRLEVRAEIRDAFDALRDVEGIVTVNPRGSASGNTILELQAEDGVDIRAAAARAVVAANIDLLSLSQVSLSLEDVFLELTTKDSAAVSEVTPAKPAIFTPISAIEPRASAEPLEPPLPGTAEIKESN